MGSEVAGEIVGIGENVTKFKVNYMQFIDMAID